MERDQETIERILQQFDMSYELACDIYDEMERQKKLARAEVLEAFKREAAFKKSKFSEGMCLFGEERFKSFEKRIMS